MAYCTQADILKRLTENELLALADDDNDGSVDADIVTEAIADADAEIDGYVGTRHAVPLATVPALVLRLSVTIAINNLYLRRTGSLPDSVKTAYDRAVAMLRDISKGTLSLGADDPDGSPPDTDRVRVATTNNAKIFGRGNTEEF
jgi:phage gp36-like protein